MFLLTSNSTLSFNFQLVQNLFIFASLLLFNSACQLNSCYWCRKTIQAEVRTSSNLKSINSPVSTKRQIQLTGPQGSIYHGLFGLLSSSKVFTETNLLTNVCNNGEVSV